MNTPLRPDPTRVESQANPNINSQGGGGHMQQPLRPRRNASSPQSTNVSTQTAGTKPVTDVAVPANTRSFNSTSVNANHRQQPANDESSREDTVIGAHSYKVHGSKAALDIKCVEHMKDSEKHLVDREGNRAVFHTIRLEAASICNGQSRSYKWHESVMLRLTRNELPLFIGVCFGLLTKIKFSNHGMFNDKGKYFIIEHQTTHLFFTLGQPKDSAANPNEAYKSVPVCLPDALEIGLKALSQYCRNHPHLDSMTVLDQIKTMCGIYSSAGFNEVIDKLPMKR
ncbi:hypothetical protein ACPV5O_24820 [Vibrio maritimus]|jgi:hypothetical protein|uniref:hypothetical protein n=1 Tax=Vibrio maritimus TaxID=990268 RepID=UPI00406780FF